MKAPVSWLDDFVPGLRDVPTSALSDAFDSLGLVVEGVETVGRAFDGIIVAEVLATRTHPDADRMQLVDMRVADGAEPLQVVCGAFNFGPGDRVPLATVGTVMPGGLVIERSKKRGEWSNGMLCSARELELSDDHSGIMILDVKAPLGTPLKDALGLEADTVFDLAVEANRPDAMCILGIARDIAPRLGLVFNQPTVAPTTISAPSSPRAVVEAPDLCPRFVAAVVRHVRVGPSPDQIAARLTMAGMRPISNVVDASNYVMLEFGVPTHPYDMRRVGGGRLGTRWARSGETLITLDGTVRQLAVAGVHDGVITDGDDAVIGLAGIMGGASSEISDDTADVLFEAAWWAPMAIARTTKRLSMRTEASARFEKGTDIEAIGPAVARFIEILRLTCPDLIVESIQDIRVGADSPVPLRLRTARTNLVLGSELSDDEVASLLRPIGFTVVPVPGEPGVHSVTVPSWRPDCEAEINLVEEVGRHHGYDKVPRRTPANDRVGRLTPLQLDRRRIRQALVGAGASEAWTATLLAAADHERAGLDSDGVVLANPMVAEESMLRTSLRPGLLRALAHNVNHRNPAVRFFETGHTFRTPRPDQVVPYEREMVAAALTGDGHDGPDDARAAKRLLDVLIEATGVKPAAVTLRSSADLPGLHPTRSALILGAGTGGAFGVVGEIDPQVCARYGIERRVGWLELDVENLLGLPRQTRLMKTFSRYPSSDIDLAFVADDKVGVVDIERVLRRSGGDLLEWVRLFDVYRGPGVASGRRSLAFRLRLVAPDRTLTDAEVATVRQRCIDSVAKVGGQLRG